VRLWAPVLLGILFFAPCFAAPTTISITVSTDRSDYSPGETVRFNGKVTSSSTPVGGAVVVFELRNPKNSTIASGYATTSGDGSYKKEVVLPSDAPSGTYGIHVNTNYQGQVASAKTTFSTPRAQTTAGQSVTSRCIIATAVYGSDLAPEVQLLRSFRDQKLLSTFAGCQFMTAFNAFYYSFSPAVAKIIASNSFPAEVARIILAPLIHILRIFTLMPRTEVAVVFSGLMATTLVGMIYLTPPMAILGAFAKRLRVDRK